MSTDSIKNIEDLIRQYTGPRKKVVSSDVKRLTAPGENYMGIVLKVEATLKNENNEEESFSAIAKCLNFGVNEFKRRIVPIQYKKEKSFYAEIVPTLQEFIDENQVELNFADIFPKLYASRSSLNDNNGEPDENAVLLFENLDVEGFSNIDRTVGLDVEGAKVILKDLAAFHAVPIALKLKKPDVFENKVKKHLYSPVPRGPQSGPKPPGITSSESMWLEILKEYDEVKPYLKQLETKIKANRETLKEFNNKTPKEPFASVAHTDLWTNNTMQVIVNGKVVKNKIIDFQQYAYDTVADDLIFFLWSSLELHVVQKEFDDLVRFYHSIFIDILGKLGCDISQFSYENLLKEVEEMARLKLNHILFMLIPIFGKKGEAAFTAKQGPMNMKKEKISDEARIRAAQLVEDFGKRGWL